MKLICQLLKLSSFILLIILLFVRFPPVFALNNEIIHNSASVDTEYQLPWPGILPDNSLYKIKVIRDRLVLSLIQSPQKKLEFYLLLADKGIYAAQILFDEGKIDLSKSTALKAEHNYTLLATDYKWMRWLSKPVPKELDNKIKEAAIKHQEVLSKIIIRTKNDDDKNTFSEVFNFSVRNLQDLNKKQ